MSKIAISGASTGTATFTIESPATSTNRTITIPDATTTLVGTDATQTLTNKSIVATQLTGTIAAARLPAGSVIQVVSNTSTPGGSGNNTSYAATSLTASITTLLANSRIFVAFSYSSQSSGGGNSAEFALRYSGDSYTANIWEGMNYSYSGSWSQSAGHPTAVHSPNASAGTSLTYKIYAKGNGGGWYINDGWGRMDGRWTAVLMEIAP